MVGTTFQSSCIIPKHCTGHYSVDMCCPWHTFWVSGMQKRYEKNTKTVSFTWEVNYWKFTLHIPNSTKFLNPASNLGNSLQLPSWLSLPEFHLRLLVIVELSLFIKWKFMLVTVRYSSSSCFLLQLIRNEKSVIVYITVQPCESTGNPKIDGRDESCSICFGTSGLLESWPWRAMNRQKRIYFV